MKRKWLVVSGQKSVVTEGRNTAPAAALAAIEALAASPDALLLVLPADHFIRDEDALCRAVEAAIPLANVYAALEAGVATFDCSAAGLGGCPFAKGATGNVASEDVLFLLQGLGIETGVDMTRLRRASRYILDVLHRAPASRVARALDARDPLPAA